MMGKVKLIVQHGSKKNLSSQSITQIVFLCCGLFTSIAGSIGIGYIIHIILLPDQWKQVLQPLIFFCVALILGMLDLVLWLPKPDFVPSGLEEPSPDETQVPHRPLQQPSYPPAVDPDATVISLPQDQLPFIYSPVLERPQAFRYYILPREGSNLERCADKLSFNEKKGRYAVADGVGTSFLPGYWAQTIAREFVERDIAFKSPNDIVLWQKKCSELWHTWVETEWVPQAFAESGQEDWGREIDLGAATTFVGCSFRSLPPAQNRATAVSVVVVGDAEFFLLTPAGEQPGHWTCKEFFRLQHFQDFGQMTETLATPERRFSRDHKWMHHQEYTALREDCIVLTTDALAQWILQQMESSKDPWRELLSLFREEDFRDFVYRCRAAGEIEVDDTTMMIIPLHS